MGFISIETVIRKNKRFTMEIPSKGLYAINCGLSKNLEFIDKVLMISIYDGVFLVLTEDRDFRDSSVHSPFLKDNRESNNIDAYDWQGNHLWNIGDLVGDIKMQFDSLHYISTKDARKYYGLNCLPSTTLYACISGGFVYIIDIKKKKLLSKIAGKIR